MHEGEVWSDKPIIHPSKRSTYLEQIEEELARLKNKED
jgi:hypothetical protein